MGRTCYLSQRLRVDVYDASGETLEGSKGEYVLVTEAPPVKAFWSITAYDSTTGRLHPNDDDRYHINNTTAVKNEDGTYTFHFKVKCEDGDGIAWRSPPGRSTWPHVLPSGAGDHEWGVDDAAALPRSRRIKARL